MCFVIFLLNLQKLLFLKAMIMKKITPILLLAISLLLVCACSHDKNTTSTDHELDPLRIENDRLKKD